MILTKQNIPPPEWVKILHERSGNYPQTFTLYSGISFRPQSKSASQPRSEFSGVEIDIEARRKETVLSVFTACPLWGVVNCTHYQKAAVEAMQNLQPPVERKAYFNLDMSPSRSHRFFSWTRAHTICIDGNFLLYTHRLPFTMINAPNLKRFRIFRVAYDALKVVPPNPVIPFGNLQSLEFFDCCVCDFGRAFDCPKLRASLKKMVVHTTFLVDPPADFQPIMLPSVHSLDLSFSSHQSAWYRGRARAEDIASIRTHPDARLFRHFAFPALTSLTLRYFSLSPLPSMLPLLDSSTNIKELTLAEGYEYYQPQDFAPILSGVEKLSIIRLTSAEMLRYLVDHPIAFPELNTISIYSTNGSLDIDELHLRERVSLRACSSRKLRTVCLGRGDLENLEATLVAWLQGKVKLVVITEDEEYLEFPGSDVQTITSTVI